MLEVITCTCLTCLGEKIPLYDFILHKIKNDFYQANYAGKITADHAQWEANMDLKLGALLDSLHIKKICCRMNMMGKVKVSTLINAQPR